MTLSPQLRVIPVWVRVLAGVVVAAAGLAIVLLIRSVPGQVIDGVAFIRLAALAILYLCVIVLFGYAAVSGLPPSHWWRNAGHAWWPARSGTPADSGTASLPGPASRSGIPKFANAGSSTPRGRTNRACS